MAGDTAHGDLEQSFRTRTSLTDNLLARLPVTLEPSLAAPLLSVVVGVGRPAGSVGVPLCGRFRRILETRDRVHMAGRVWDGKTSVVLDTTPSQ